MIERMKAEGKIKELDNGEMFVKGEDGKWYKLEETDMGHIPEDAVSYWNREGYQKGAKSKDVREWMLNSENYELEPRTINRSKGGQSQERYREPLSDEN